MNRKPYHTKYDGLYYILSKKLKIRKLLACSFNKDLNFDVKSKIFLNFGLLHIRLL